MNHYYKKGVYPHDYMDSFNKFEDPHLPPKSLFYSLLNESEILDEYYQYT